MQSNGEFVNSDDDEVVGRNFVVGMDSRNQFTFTDQNTDEVLFKGEIPELYESYMRVLNSPWCRLTGFFEINSQEVSWTRIALCAVAIGMNIGAKRPTSTAILAIISTINLAVLGSFLIEFFARWQFRRIIKKELNSDKVNEAVERVTDIIQSTQTDDDADCEGDTNRDSKGDSHSDCTDCPNWDLDGCHLWDGELVEDGNKDVDGKDGGEI